MTVSLDAQVKAQVSQMTTDMQKDMDAVANKYKIDNNNAMQVLGVAGKINVGSGGGDPTVSKLACAANFAVGCFTNPIGTILGALGSGGAAGGGGS